MHCNEGRYFAVGNNRHNYHFSDRQYHYYQRSRRPQNASIDVTPLSMASISDWQECDGIIIKVRVTAEKQELRREAMILQTNKIQVRRARVAQKFLPPRVRRFGRGRVGYLQTQAQVMPCWCIFCWNGSCPVTLYMQSRA